MEKYEGKTEFQQSLEEIIRDGARKMLQQAVENEVEEFVKQFCDVKNEQRHRLITKNGYLPEREIQTGVGPLKVKKPRVKGETFTSAILPRYMRRTPSIDALIPALYLRGCPKSQITQVLACEPKY